jgi:hypothetical protein
LLSGKWKILREVVLLWGFLGCDHQDALHKETIMLQDRTIPPAASRIERFDLMRNNSGATAWWHFDPDRDWEAYTTWVTDNLPSYTAENTGTTLRLVRRLPGDVFELQLERTLVDNVWFVRVNFPAFPQ